jgi:3-oxoacyl-[acyl-carrier protein] reductase
MLNPGGEVSWTSERINQLPLRRIGRPEEVAGTVVLLASEVDGALYTGQTLGPNSGDVM